MTPIHTEDAQAGVGRPRWFAETVRLIIAPLVLFFSGLFTADFMLSGMYTWPRTSRVFVLTLTIGVLAYEFVYKEQRALMPQRPLGRAVRAVVASCLIPYVLGVAALVVLARL